MHERLIKSLVLVIAMTMFSCGPRNSSSTTVPSGPKNLTAFENESSGLWGFRDAAGHLVITPRYRFAQDFVGSIGTVLDEDGWAIIDGTGAVVLRPFNFDNGPDPFEEGLARYVDRHGRFGFYDETGRIVIPARFDFAEPFVDGAALVCMECKLIPHGEHRMVSGGRWGRINAAGEFITPPGSVER